MKNKSGRKQITILMIAVLMVLLICGGIYISATAYDERAAMVSSDGDNVNVRSDAGTGYDVVATLADKTEVTIIGETLASDGAKWYELRFTVNGETKTGFMHSTYVIYKDYSGLDEVEKMTFEELLAEFPESYRTRLLILHDMYPNWKFVAQKTGLEWSDALEAESTKGRSLVSTGAISSWKSTEGEAYNWNTSTWKGMDGDKWVTASREIVAHYLDPRNYLDGSMIFAFITHGYDEADQTLDGVRAIIGKSFMANNFVEGNTEYEYASVLLEAGRTYGVSPYVLAAMIRIELGYNGSGSVSGTEAGYEGLYNYYNVGAYKTATMSAIQRGLWYAGGEGVGNTSYGRPWNTRYKALLGGAEFYATNYVNGGQNTLYLKRFNVMTENPYTHQYMTNIQGASSEANVYSLAYNAEAKQQNLVFYIPVYNNMPETPAAKPTKTGSPNNKLDSISVDGTALADFDMDKSDYRIEVEADVQKIKLTAAAKDSTAAIAGTGEKVLAMGENKFTVIVTAQNGDVRTYTVTIVRKVDKDASLSALSVTGYELTPAFGSGVYEYSVTIPAEADKVEIKATATSKLAKVEVGNGENLAFGENVITVKVTAGDGVTVSEYKVKVTRQAATDATLSELSVAGFELSAAFDPEVKEYSVAIPEDQAALEITAKATSSLAKVEITGAEEIPVGESVITVKVTAGDGETVLEYLIRVTRPEATDTTLSALSVTGIQLVPGFDPAVSEYSVLIPAEQTALEITAAATSSLAKVEITGAEEIPVGQSVITIKVTSGNETAVSEYHITVERPVANVGVTLSSEVYTVGEDKYITGLKEQPVNAETFEAGLTVTGGTLKITAADGVSQVTTVGTGTLVKVYDESGVICDVYTVVVYGDVSGDGKIDALDLMTVRQYLKKKVELSGVYAVAADVSRDGKIDALDLMMLRQHLKLRLVIEQ
ncbi:MAG: cadherin-like beta sandwich domain-containing protein [Lachnospiraceae bacterium]|nr:cadherin-like beta sandwich domain-containing protein [Lachnospiraceae bacterium]